MAMDLAAHPCFNEQARGRAARVHLPVAPRCNVQCHYCDRRCDCVNESRPGVTSAILTPGQALAYWRRLKARRADVAVVGIAGPGDPFANADETLETLRLIRAEDPDVLLCVATNGLALEPHVGALAALRVSHVTVTLNAVDPAIGARLYAWVRHERRVRTGIEAAEILWARQRAALRRLKAEAVTIKINMVVVPGINDGQVEAVAQTARAEGAAIMNVIPLLPAPGSAFAGRAAPTPEQIHGWRDLAGRHLPQMAHCARCRADACGLVGEANALEVADELAALAAGGEAAPVACCAARAGAPADLRPYVAVASREGVLVNQHLGEAERLLVFAPETGGYRLVAERPTAPRGGGDGRWRATAAGLADCRAVLVGGVGPAPRRILEAAGLAVMEAEGPIEDLLACVFEGRPLPPGMSRRFAGCGHACTGQGGGCG